MQFKFTHSGSTPERLDRALLELVKSHAECRGLTRSQIKNMVEAGNVRVNEAVATKCGLLVKPGARLELNFQAAEPSKLEVYARPLDVLFEDESLLVLNKPAGLSMHPGAGNRSTTLVNALLHHFSIASEQLPNLFSLEAAQSDAADLRPGIVHRLDKDTTGVVVVAKTLAVLNNLARQFSSRSVGRAYLALVLNLPRKRSALKLADHGVVNAAIGRHPVRRKEMSVLSDQKGRQAVTHWKVRERLPYANLLEVRLETGRTHQIRVHMSHIGNPVIGDRAYGDFSGLPAPLKQAQLDFSRQALHAYLLAFTHPVTGERLSFSAEPPPEMLSLIQIFREFK